MHCRPGLEAIVADAADHVAQLATDSPGLTDLVCIDLFDANDAVPAFLTSPGMPRYLLFASATLPEVTTMLYVILSFSMLIF